MKKDLLLITDLFPSQNIGIVMLYVGFFLVMGYLISKFSPKKVPTSFGYMGAILIAAGSYVFTLDYIDEVFTNLSHPRNLFLTGHYSVSPGRWQSGTADLLYYFLYTPFAFTKSGLIFALGLGGLLFTLLAIHFTSLKSSVDRKDLKIVFFAILASCFPVIQVYSNGLGNLFLLVFFSLSIYFMFSKKKNYSMLVASFLPLIRPDGIVLAFAMILPHLLTDRKVALKYLAITAGALTAYITTSFCLYGEFLPTPVYFKSFKLPMIEMIKLDDFKNFLLLFAKVQYLFLLAPFIFFKSLVKDPLFKKGFLSFLLLIPPILLINLINFNPVFDNRYGLPLVIVLFSLSFYAVSVVSEKLHCRSKKDLALILSLIFIVGVNIFSGTSERQLYKKAMTRAEGLGVGGQIFKSIIPKDWKIAVTEMNTFGFMAEHTVIDLWGYSSLPIAKSKICSARRIRSNPSYFLESDSDLFWFRTGYEGSSHGRIISKYLESPERLAMSVNMSKFYNQLGPIPEVVNKYDLVVTKTKRWYSLFFVKKTRTETFLNRLKSSNYTLEKERKLDYKVLEELYEKQNFNTYQCG